MIRVCPNPGLWNEVYGRLNQYARTHRCSPSFPPVPLILGGWWATNDFEKIIRWEETVAWATSKGCADLVEVPSEDFYCVDEPTSYTPGPMGGPMYRPWDYEEKEKPLTDQIRKHLETLISCWEDIVGPELAGVCSPLAFTGAKARRLLVRVHGAARPPWGGWSSLSNVEAERRAFTRFRASINTAIAPHEVDHIDFTTQPAS
jgi:hypothetical protein